MRILVSLSFFCILKLKLYELLDNFISMKHLGPSGVAGQLAAHHVVVDLLSVLENVWDLTNSALLS